MKLLNVCYVPADIQAHHDDLDCHRSLELGNGVHWPQKDWCIFHYLNIFLKPTYLLDFTLQDFLSYSTYIIHESYQMCFTAFFIMSQG